jgi:hypothetical protein
LNTGRRNKNGKKKSQTLRSSKKEATRANLKTEKVDYKHRDTFYKVI